MTILIWGGITIVYTFLVVYPEITDINLGIELDLQELFEKRKFQNNILHQRIFHEGRYPLGLSNKELKIQIKNYYDIEEKMIELKRKRKLEKLAKETGVIFLLICIMGLTVTGADDYLKAVYYVSKTMIFPPYVPGKHVIIAKYEPDIEENQEEWDE